MRLSAELIGQAEQRPNPLGEWELVLRGYSIPTIEHLGVTRNAYDAIDLSDNSLTSLENFPRLIRLKSLSVSKNMIESIADPSNLQKNLPNLENLVLTDNRISGLHELAKIGDGCPKLKFLRRQHYRLYAIQKIPSLKVLDFCKVTKAESEKAKRLAKSAAGAALEVDVQQEAREAATNKTFVPGGAGGKSAKESFTTNFTPEQKEQIRQMIANAKSPAEIEYIENSVKRGEFPSAAVTKTTTTTIEEEEEGGGNKRPININDNDASTIKKARVS